MKKHTKQEEAQALQNSPKPIRGFLRTAALTNIYQGIAKKLTLDLRQMLGVTEITYTTLIGLEPESGLETAIHQVLPELSNEKTRELVADINDRIFKEAGRRLQENIIEPESPLVVREPTDAELEALGEREKREGIMPEFEKKKAEEEALQPILRAEEEKRAALRPKEVAEEDEEPDALQTATAPAKQGVAKLQAALTDPNLPSIRVQSPTPSIAEQKLRAATTVSSDITVGEVLKETPVLRKRIDGIDPYREIPD